MVPAYLFLLPHCWVVAWLSSAFNYFFHGVTLLHGRTMLAVAPIWLTMDGSNVSRAPRVGHKKSRKGCAQCKRRHVKVGVPGFLCLLRKERIELTILAFAVQRRITVLELRKT